MKEQNTLATERLADGKSAKFEEIANLKQSLSSHVSPIGDWKGIKQREYIEMGLTPPYSAEEMQDYYARRKSARDRINELENELKA